MERVSTIDKLWLELNAACRQIIRCQSKLNGCHWHQGPHLSVRQPNPGHYSPQRDSKRGVPIPPLEGRVGAYLLIINWGMNVMSGEGKVPVATPLPLMVAFQATGNRKSNTPDLQFLLWQKVIGNSSGQKLIKKYWIDILITNKIIESVIKKFVLQHNLLFGPKRTFHKLCMWISYKIAKT